MSEPAKPVDGASSPVRPASMATGPQDPGDVWVTAADGNSYWGGFGAAGLLAYDPRRDAVLLQHRATWSDHGDTWGIPGGARHEGESAVAAALRESHEEAGVPEAAIAARFTHTIDRGGWTYTTLIGEVTNQFEPQITDAESHALEWVPVDEVEERELHPGFAASWRDLERIVAASPVVIVDAANVIGSVPDGWWKDRRGAAERMRDRLDAYLRTSDGVRSGFLGLPEARLPGLDRAYPTWVLVTEGVARGIAQGESVEVLDAPELGDDAIVAAVTATTRSGRIAAVVTSDAELRTRVEAAGAVAVHGASTLVKLLAPRREGSR